MGTPQTRQEWAVKSRVGFCTGRSASTRGLLAWVVSSNALLDRLEPNSDWSALASRAALAGGTGGGVPLPKLARQDTHCA